MRDDLHEQHPDFLRCAPFLLDHLPKLDILRRFHSADGQELNSKFTSVRSSSALAANVFGIFCAQPELLSFPSELTPAGICLSFNLEERLRFPWNGGRHPNLDAVAYSESEIIAIGCKRLEPFDPHAIPTFEETYWRPEWGKNMQRFQQALDKLHTEDYRPQHLDARQLVKHALGLRTQAHKKGTQARLIYVYINPLPESIICQEAQLLHRKEVGEFAKLVAGDEVHFEFTTYAKLLTHWTQSSTSALSDHAQCVVERFVI